MNQSIKSIDMGAAVKKKELLKEMLESDLACYFNVS